MCRFLIKYWWVLVASMAAGGVCAAPDSSSLYKDVEASVYQVQVVNPVSRKKTAIGSGFVVMQPNLLATNYHVVSTYVNDPENFDLDYLSTSGKTGKLELLAVDVIHDLAVLRADEPLGLPLSIAPLPPKGAQLFSLGNPLDLGFYIADVTNNGMMQGSDDNNILISGSLNPGMSGGPTLDAKGAVVGINVATSGNDISFLVPAQYLAIILERLKMTGFEPDSDIPERIAEQLQEHSEKYLQQLDKAKWTPLPIHKLQVPGDMGKYVRCWDNSTKPDADDLGRMAYTRCANDGNIYLDDGLEVGSIAYEYIWLSSDKMIAPRFYNYFQQQNSSVMESGAGKDDVTNFACHTAFTQVAEQDFKMTVCRRDYLNYPGLSDFVLTGAMVGHKDEGMIFNLDMSGVDFTQALKLAQRMLGEFQWKK